MTLTVCECGCGAQVQPRLSVGAPRRYATPECSRKVKARRAFARSTVAPEDKIGRLIRELRGEELGL